MRSGFISGAALVGAIVVGSTHCRAQSASAIYTWNGTGNIQQWFRNFGTNSVFLGNTTPGELTVSETGSPGSNVAITDDFNRVRETPVAPSGGLDLTGLTSLEFDIGHNGAGNINVQFFVQAGTGSSFVALGPDVVVTPGVNTYSVPLSGLTADQLVYIRTLGYNARDHIPLGNVTWTVREVRSAGAGLLQRDLGTFDNGTVEGGLQGMIVNFDNASVVGNNGGQNQTGLGHNAGGSGSLQWTDAAGGNGAALSMGNGTAWGGNTFFDRVADLSNYQFVVLTMSATDALGGGGSVNVQSFFQTNGFNEFQTPGTLPLPIDGQFHDLIFPLAGLINMNVVDQTGLNLGSHTNQLVMNVDNIRFLVPEPASAFGMAAVGLIGLLRRPRNAN